MKKADPFTYEPHVFHKDVKVCGKQYCLHCGLIYLNNRFTQWAVQKGCNCGDHPDHERMRRSTSGS